MRDGRKVVDLRGVERGHEFAIEADVYPVTGMRLEPLRMGPYAFATLDDAIDFVEEALLALEYLGCGVATGAESASDLLGEGS